MPKSDDEWKAGCAVFAVLFAVSLCTMPFMLFGCDATYSEGHRDGTLQKFSTKGFFVKSHEGELALPGFRIKGESTSNTFDFSVDDPSIVKQLEDMPADTMLRITYRQVLLNGKLFHSTSYRAVRVEKIAKAKD